MFESQPLRRYREKAIEVERAEHDFVQKPTFCLTSRYPTFQDITLMLMIANAILVLSRRILFETICYGQKGMLRRGVASGTTNKNTCEWDISASFWCFPLEKDGLHLHASPSDSNWILVGVLESKHLLNISPDMLLWKFYLKASRLSSHMIN